MKNNLNETYKEKALEQMEKDGICLPGPLVTDGNKYFFLTDNGPAWYLAVEDPFFEGIESLLCRYGLFGEEPRHAYFAEKNTWKRVGDIALKKVIKINPK